MADSVKTFQTHLTSVMDSLIRASVCEITKLFQDTVNDYLLEISLNSKENEALKLRLRLTENKLRSEQMYGTGWAASHRASGLLASDVSGRKRRRCEIPGVEQREGSGFWKGWAGSHLEERGAAAGEAGEEARDVFLVQPQGAVEDKQVCAPQEREEVTSIKEESPEMESRNRPETLQLIQEALQMDPANPTPRPGPRTHLEGDGDTGAGLHSIGERGPVEQGPGEKECAVAPPPIKEGGVEEKVGFGERHRPRPGMRGVGEELNGLETALKAERGGERDPAGVEPNGARGGDFADSAPEGLWELKYAMAQKYIGLDGMCSSEQNAAGAVHPAERDRLDLLGFAVPAFGMDPLPGWPEHGREGDGVAVERLAALPGPLEVPSFVSAGVGAGPGEGGDFAYFCVGCGAGFVYAADLEDHLCLLPVENQTQSQSCGVCRTTFSQAAHLPAHMRLHSGEPSAERPYCPQCGRSFSTLANLKRHQRIHTGERPYACATCGERFSRVEYLSRHQQIHTGERPYAWGKSFRRMECLKRHKRIHTGERPYACAACGKGFRDGQCLKRHQQIHTGERPYACATCGKSFARMECLKRHQQIHTGERPYACASCGKSFTRMENLKRHQQMHSGKPSPLQCIHCGSAFSAAELLKDHRCVYTV